MAPWWLALPCPVGYLWEGSMELQGDGGGLARARAYPRPSMGMGSDREGSPR